MLIASDPIIASKRRSHHKKRKPFSKEVLEMLDVSLVETEDKDGNDEESLDEHDDSDIN